MLIRRWRRGLLFPAAVDLDQPLKFMRALAALFYPTVRHCSSSIPHISVAHLLTKGLASVPSFLYGEDRRNHHEQLCWDGLPGHQYM